MRAVVLTESGLMRIQDITLVYESLHLLKSNALEKLGGLSVSGGWHQHGKDCSQAHLELNQRDVVHTSSIRSIAFYGLKHIQARYLTKEKAILRWNPGRGARVTQMQVNGGANEMLVQTVDIDR
ncbi:hypothetical protein TKK_0002975 [Trichogramma kaykai]